jgi:hypothetical protein
LRALFCFNIFVWFFLLFSPGNYGSGAASFVAWVSVEQAWNKRVAMETAVLIIAVQGALKAGLAGLMAAQSPHNTLADIVYFVLPMEYKPLLDVAPPLVRHI